MVALMSNYFQKLNSNIFLSASVWSYTHCFTDGQTRGIGTDQLAQSDRKKLHLRRSASVFQSYWNALCTFVFLLQFNTTIVKFD